jgi:hypothetical protein
MDKEIWGGRGGGTMYTHVSKCKNDKIKGGNKKQTKFGNYFSWPLRGI